MTLNAVGYETREYMGSAASESEEDNEADKGTISTEPQATAAQNNGEQDVREVDNPLNDSLAVAELESSLQDKLPVLIAYDYEAKGGNIQGDHTIEMYGKAFAVSYTVATSKPEYSCLIHLSKE